MRKSVLLILACVCVLISPFASGLPDGLESVLHTHELSALIQSFDWPIMADYSVSMIENGMFQGWIAGISGALVVAVCSLGMTSLVRKKHALGKQI